MWPLVGIALAPVFAILIFVYLRDPEEPEPFHVLLLSFLLGACSVFAAIILEVYGVSIGLGNKQSIGGLFIYTFLLIAGVEEGLKFILIRFYSYRKKCFNEPYDGIIYSVMVSMGFASVENVLYIFESDDPYHTGLLRMFTAVPAHATFAVIMGYFMGLSKFKGIHAIFYQLTGLLAAMVFHGTYDFFLMQQFIPGISAGAFVSLGIGIWLSLKALKIHGRKGIA